MRSVEIGFGMALLLLALALCLHPAPANDLFWQLRVGNEILSGHRIPHQDHFSWTRSGTPWVAHEWLTFALFAGAYHLFGGFAGVWLLQWLLSACIILAVYVIVLRETGGAALLSFALTAAAALICGAFFEPRPQLFTYLFLVATLGIVLPARRSSAPYRTLLLLPPLYMLWSNLHAGVLVGTGILLLGAVAETLSGLSAGTQITDLRHAVTKSAAVPLAVTGLLCGMATLCTPYTWHVYANMRATLGNSTAMDRVVEWASPDFHAHEGKILEILLGLVAWGLLATRLRRDGIVLATLGFLIHSALFAYRNVPLLALAGVILIAPHVQSALNGMLADLAGKSNTAQPSTLFTRHAPPALCGLIALLFATLWTAQTIAQLAPLRRKAGPLPEAAARYAIQLDDFPEAACRFLENRRFPARTRIFNEYDDGGYLIWRLPQYRVFIDGRADIYFGPALEDYVRIHTGQGDWQQLLDRYDPDVMVLGASSVLAHFVRSSPQWKLIFTNEPARTAALDAPTGSQVFLRRDRSLTASKGMNE